MTARASAISILLVAVAIPAYAGDWYVDAMNGSDANGGTSWSDAWRTISHAVDTVSATGVERFHVASGTYDTALGESFPIRPDTKFELLGEGGFDPPVINA